MPTTQPRPPASPREQLAKELSEVKLLGPVLEALSEPQRKALQRVVDGLPPDEKTQLVDEAGPYPERRPLLHLIAGGNSPRARLTLATSSRGVEMLLLTQGTEPEHVKALLPHVQQLARRAAAEWLRERSSALASDDVLTADHYEAIAQAAEVLGLRSLSHHALTLAAEMDPGAARFLQLAAAAAGDGAVDEAKLAFSHAGKNAEPELREQVAPVVAAAERLAKAGERSNSAQARDHLLIGDVEGAAKLLEGSSTQDLSSAVLRARVALEDSSCPGVPGLMASPLLCRVAFGERAEDAKLFASLDAAWKGKAGRDVDSVAGYVALRFAIPFLYGIDVEGKPEVAARDALADRLATLQSVLQEASVVSPRFAHAALFVETLHGAVEHPEGPSKEVVAALVERAEGVRSCADCSDDPAQAAWSEAAIVAVASRVSGEIDVRKLLVASALAPGFGHPRATLMAWSALAAADREGAEAAITELAKLIEDSADRTDTVLELAELQHAVAPDERTSKVLESAGRRLAQGPLVFELRARGALDAAGIAAKRGDLQAAVQVLEGVIGKSPAVSSRLEKELLELVHCYLLVLRGRMAKGTERAEYVQKLKARRGPTASVDVWRELWVLELGRLAAKAGCRGNAACIAAVSKRGRPSAQSLQSRVGRSEAQMLERGLFGLRSADMALASEAHSRLSLDVDFRPLWLSVEVPY